MIKRLMSLILSLCLMTSVVYVKAFAAETGSEVFKEITLSMYSNLCADTSISGLYADNVFYIPLDKLCSMVNGKIVSQSDKEVTIEVAIRSFVLTVGSGNMIEKTNHGNNNIKMPSMYVDGKIYISALHFLTYIGAVAEINENANPQFIVVKRYDIFDAIIEMACKDSGHFFWWDEFDVEFKDLERKIVNAGLVTLIAKDSNVFRMMFDAKGMEQDAVEEALLTIVKNEAADYFDNPDIESERIDKLSNSIGVVSDWIGLVADAYDDIPGLSDQVKKLVSDIGDMSGEVATSATFANNIYQAVESLKQFDNIQATQKDLLANTILKYTADSKTLNGQWKVVVEAAEKIDDKIQGEYAKQIDFATQTAEATAYDFVNGAAAAGTNPVAIAWDSAILLTKFIPASKEMIDRKSKLYNAYNCSMIQLIANEMLVEAYSDWYYGDYSEPKSMFESSNPSTKLNDIKQLMVLQLKSTLTTREYLIESGFVEKVYADQLEEINTDIAILLNKIENCKVPSANMFNVEYSGDLTWLENINFSSVSSEEAVIVWEEFLKTKRYVTYTNNWSDSELEYTIVDINEDDMPELLIQAPDMEFYNTWTFVLDGEEIVLANEMYGYGSFRYSTFYNMIIGSPEWKPFDGTGYLPFYELTGCTLKLVFEIGMDEWQNFYIDEEGNEKSISDEERSSYYDDVISFDWKRIQTLMPYSKSNKEDLAEYLDTDLFKFIGLFEDMYDAGATDGSIEYKNDAVVVSAVYGSTLIDFISITEDYEYSIEGIEYGMSILDAMNVAYDLGYSIEEDLPYYKYFIGTNGKTLSFHAENEKSIDNICINSQYPSGEISSYNSEIARPESILGVWDAYEGEARLIFQSTGNDFTVTYEGMEFANGTIQIINFINGERDYADYIFDGNEIIIVKDLEKYNFVFSLDGDLIQIDDEYFYRVKNSVAKKLIGTWENDELEIEFKSVYEVVFRDKTGYRSDSRGFYAVLNDSSVWMGLGYSDLNVLDYSVNGTELNLSGSMLYREGGGWSIPELEEILIGTWICEGEGSFSDEYYIFTEDGHFEYYSSEHGYKYNDPTQEGVYEIISANEILAYNPATGVYFPLKQINESGQLVEGSSIFTKID